MNNRLEQFLAAENISQSQFADTIDVARASVSHILAGRNKPGWDFLNSMLKHYPNLNIEWLLNGTGKMYKSMRSELRPAQPEEQLSSDLFSPVSTTGQAPQQPTPAATTPRESKIQEQTVPTNASTETSASQDSPAVIAQQSDNQRKITKIVVFYDDNTFIEIK